MNQSRNVKGTAIENVRKPKRCSRSTRMANQIQNKQQKQSSGSCCCIKEGKRELVNMQNQLNLGWSISFSVTNEWQHLRHLKTVAHALCQPVDFISFKWMCSYMTSFFLSLQWKNMKLFCWKKKNHLYNLTIIKHFSLFNI